MEGNGIAIYIFPREFQNKRMFEFLIISRYYEGLKPKGLLLPFVNDYKINGMMVSISKNF